MACVTCHWNLFVSCKIKLGIIIQTVVMFMSELAWDSEMFGETYTVYVGLVYLSPRAVHEIDKLFATNVWQNLRASPI